MLQRETLRRLWPHCPPAIVDGSSGDKATALFLKYGLTTPLSVAVFMAHISHECGAGLELVENLSYSAQRMVAVWPKRFPSVASAMPYAHNPRKLANKVYNGRMGNRTGSDDGYNFRGRGATNATGHDGYHALALKMALDLLSDPDKVNDPGYFLECGIVDFILCNCLQPALRGDMRTSCKRLNGGLTGLDQRNQWFRRWQAALAAEHGGDAVSVPLPQRKPEAIAQIGDKNAVVTGVQAKLNEKGYSCGAEDGEFHETTQAAVNAFKSDNDLPADGVIDHATIDALHNSPDRPVSDKRANATVDDLRDLGSSTIAASDKIGIAGKMKMWLGGLGVMGFGSDQLGVFDSLQGAVDKGKEVYSWWDSVKDVALPLLHSPLFFAACVGLLIIGAVVFLEAKKIEASRLDDHRSAANLGR